MACNELSFKSQAYSNKQAQKCIELTIELLRSVSNS